MREQGAYPAIHGDAVGLDEQGHGVQVHVMLDVALLVDDDQVVLGGAEGGPGRFRGLGRVGEAGLCGAVCVEAHEGI